MNKTMIPRVLLLAACLFAGPLFADNRLYLHPATSTVAADDKIYLDGLTNGTRALAPDFWATQDLSFNFTGNLTSVIGLRGHALPSLSTGFLRYNGSAWVFDSATYITNPLTTLGDVFVGGSSGTPTRLAQGTNGTFLGVSGGVLGYYTPIGSGNVSNTGTPTAGQAAEWTSATVVQGIAVTGSGNYVKSTGGTLTNPLIAALANLTTNGLITTSGGVGTLGVTVPGANVLTAFGVDVGSPGAIVVNGGALGTPISGTVTNLTGTASININGTVGAGTPNTGAFTTGVFGSTASITVGTAGTSVGQILFKNATSGTLTIAPPTGALGTYSITLPNAASVLPVIGQQLTFTGPTAARTVAIPDANFTIARTDAANTFTGASSASGWILTSPTITTGITPTVNDGAALGSTSLQFSDLFLASGAVVNFANGDVVLTHSSGLLTLGTGDLRITTAGTNSASVVTVGGTQSLTGKSIAALANLTSNGFVTTSGGVGTLGTSTAGANVLTALGLAANATGGFVTAGGLARITTISSSATPTVDATATDCVTITALATTITSMTTNYTAATNNFQQLEYRIKDNGSAQGITWGSAFSSGIATLPTTTVAGKVLHVWLEEDTVQGKMVCQATGSEP